MRVELVYQNPMAIRLCEYAGKKAYDTPIAETTKEAADFIERVVRRGHETVIEFSNLIIAVQKEGIEETPLFIELIHPRNGIINHLRYTEVGDYYFLHGNYRTYKDLIRNMATSENPIMDGIIDVIYRNVPKCFFIDMIEDGVLRGSRFLIDEESYPDVPKLTAYSFNDHAVDVIMLYADFIKSPDGLIVPDYEYDVNEILNDWNLEYSILMNMGRIYFDIKCQRYTANQLITHRTISKVQASQRYIKYKTGTVEDIPPHGLNTDTKYAIGVDGLQYTFSYNDIINITSQVYQAMLNNGEKAENARGVLTNAVSTELVVAFNNIDFIKHVVSLRGKKTAQYEIRQLIVAMYIKLMYTETEARIPFYDYYKGFIEEINGDDMTIELKYEYYILN